MGFASHYSTHATGLSWAQHLSGPPGHQGYLGPWQDLITMYNKRPPHKKKKKKEKIWQRGLEIYKYQHKHLQAEQARLCRRKQQRHSPIIHGQQLNPMFSCWVFEIVQIISTIIHLMFFTKEVYGSFHIALICIRLFFSFQDGYLMLIQR